MEEVAVVKYASVMVTVVENAFVVDEVMTK